jgi:hypothetical protein
MITEAKLKDYITSGHDARKIAKWLININIAKHIPLSLNDLSDTSLVAEEIDAVLECIIEGDYKDALSMAEESAYQILEDEGFELSK